METIVPLVPQHSLITSCKHFKKNPAESASIILQCKKDVNNNLAAHFLPVVKFLMLTNAGTAIGRGE